MTSSPSLILDHRRQNFGNEAAVAEAEASLLVHAFEGGASVPPRDAAAALVRDGLAVVDAVVLQSAAARLRQHVDSRLSDVCGATPPDGEPLLGQIMCRRNRWDLKLDLSEHPVAEALRQLLDALGPALVAALGRGAQLFELGALVADAGAPRQPVHPDTPYSRSISVATCMLALQDVDLSMGPTHFLPRTHTERERSASWGRDPTDDDEIAAALESSSTRIPAAALRRRGVNGASLHHERREQASRCSAVATRCSSTRGRCTAAAHTSASAARGAPSSTRRSAPAGPRATGEGLGSSSQARCSTGSGAGTTSPARASWWPPRLHSASEWPLSSRRLSRARSAWAWARLGVGVLPPPTLAVAGAGREESPPPRPPLEEARRPLLAPRAAQGPRGTGAHAARGRRRALRTDRHPRRPPDRAAVRRGGGAGECGGRAVAHRPA